MAEARLAQLSLTESPVQRAFWRLLEAARAEAAFHQAQLFALGWLAAARMVAMQTAGTVGSMNELLEPGGWAELVEAGYPKEAVDFVVLRHPTTGASQASRQAVDIVSELAGELGTRPWDVLTPFLQFAGRGMDSEGLLVPELVPVLIELLDAPVGAEVWIPFDPNGQLTVEVLRHGYRVLVASPLPSNPLVRQLLLVLETGHAKPASVRTEIERDEAGRPVTRSDYAIVTPPFGVQVKDTRMVMWDITGTRAHQQFARSESWAIFEFASRIDKRGVFVAPQGVLFSKGQEQRLREHLLHLDGSRHVESVIGLPPGVFKGTGIAGAVIVIAYGEGSEGVYMSDLSSGRRSLQEAGDIVGKERETALRRIETRKSRLVTRAEIERNEYTFSPSRYLTRVADLAEHVAKLGEICELVRPPVISKTQTAFEAIEVGIPDLNRWNPIDKPPSKMVFLKAPAKGSSQVGRGDVVISIKGSIGKVGLMGDAAEGRTTVPAQSCLVIRVAPEAMISPEVLVMYLRSPHGQAQLAGLQVGAAVQHISPSTLMDSLMVPIPPQEEYKEVKTDWGRLCGHEKAIEILNDEMARLLQKRWTHLDES